jgi:hypothetical protein
MVGTLQCVSAAKRPMVKSLESDIIFSLNLKLLEVLGMPQAASRKRDPRLSKA